MPMTSPSATRAVRSRALDHPGRLERLHAVLDHRAVPGGTGKWFRVQSNRYPFTQGYVPANVVGNQWTTSPRC